MNRRGKNPSGPPRSGGRRSPRSGRPCPSPPPGPRRSVGEGGGERGGPAAAPGGGVGAAGSFAGPALPPSAARSQGAGLPRLMSPPCSQPRGGWLRADPPRRWLRCAPLPAHPKPAGPSRAGRPPARRPSRAAPRPAGPARLTWTIKLGAAASAPVSPPPPSDSRASGRLGAGRRRAAGLGCPRGR